LHLYKLTHEGYETVEFDYAAHLHECVDICLKGNKKRSLLFRIDAPQNAQIGKFLLALSKWIVG